MLRSFLIGGLLPVIAFTLIEERFGTLWGLVAGMVFGVGEILWEWRTQRRVSPMTWGGNGILLILGGISLFTQEGIWFKLQPALIEGAMALTLWGSLILGRPLVAVMMEKMLEKQGVAIGKGATLGKGTVLNPIWVSAFWGLTLRIGLFFALHATLATWAAFHWSSASWALLKGVGFTVSMIVYMVVESLLLRYRMARHVRKILH